MPVSDAACASILGQVVERVEQATSREGPTTAQCREAFTAKVASLERQVLRDVFESFDVARIFRRRTLAQIARRAHMTPRNYRYLRSGRLSRVSLRQLLALADAHGLTFYVGVRLKEKVGGPTPVEGRTDGK